MYALWKRDSPIVTPVHTIRSQIGRGIPTIQGCIEDSGIPTHLEAGWQRIGRIARIGCGPGVWREERTAGEHCRHGQGSIGIFHS